MGEVRRSVLVALYHGFGFTVLVSCFDYDSEFASHSLSSADRQVLSQPIFPRRIQNTTSRGYGTISG